MTELLKAETNDLIQYYFSLSKQSAYKGEVWVFIDTMIRTEIMGSKFYYKYATVIRKARKILGQNIKELSGSFAFGKLAF